ncbi:MAG: TetR family transcriptional regulator [Acidimicrobiales bacterium]|nr:MAG: TetR family transcriptional regulator [Acidimicrobiales bacterium]
MLECDNSHSWRNAEPRKRPRQERSRRLVASLLDEATRLFSERGYHATTTNHVAEAAGVSVGSLYQYFPNKDALVVAVAERHLDEAMAELAELVPLLRAEEPDLADLCRILVTAVAEMNDDPQLDELLWRAPRTAALDARLDELRKIMVDEMVWHLQRLGDTSPQVGTRVRILVSSVEACVHDGRLIADEHATDELIRMCHTYLGPAAD